MKDTSAGLDDWEMSHQDECDTDKLTGLEDFGLLLRPLGLTEKKLVPDPITFTEPDPLGARVYSSADPTRAASPKGTGWIIAARCGRVFCFTYCISKYTI